MSFACYLSLSLVQQVNESQGFFPCTYPFLSAFVCVWSVWLSTICTALHFRPPIIIRTKTEYLYRYSHLIQKLLQPITSNQSQMNYYYYSSLMSSLCTIAEYAIRVHYCVRCQRRKQTTTTKSEEKKNNNVAVRPRCSRRRKYVTYANLYVALCTITGCLHSLMQYERNTQCAIFNALWNAFFLFIFLFFFFFGLSLFS